MFLLFQSDACLFNFRCKPNKRLSTAYVCFRYARPSVLTILSETKTAIVVNVRSISYMCVYVYVFMRKERLCRFMFENKNLSVYIRFDVCVSAQKIECAFEQATASCHTVDYWFSVVAHSYSLSISLPPLHYALVWLVRSLQRVKYVCFVILGQLRSSNSDNDATTLHIHLLCSTRLL